MNGTAAWKGLAGVHGLAERIEQWARQRPDVVALAFFGSLRRADRPGDDWSDVDAMIVVNSLEPWVGEADAAWVQEIGPAWINFPHPSPIPGVEVRQVIFDGGYDSDLVVVDREKLKIVTEDPETARMVFGHGYTVAFDQDHIFDTLPQPSSVADVALPGRDEFHFTVATSLYQLVWATKHFRRGEYWRACDDLDCYLKERLLKLLAWRAVVAGTPDVFPGGRQIEKWAEATDIKAARSTFSGGDPRTFAQALLAHHDLLRRIAKPIAKQLGFAYPDTADARIREWVEHRLAEAPYPPAAKAPT
jgi:aminoglycoside 6-adenylyltransferase